MSTSYGSADYRPPPGDARYQQSGSGSGESIGSILSGLITDLQSMVRGEIALARAEVKEDVSTMGRAAGELAAAAFLGLTGFIFLMLGATYVLNIWMRMWIAAAIVGLVLLAIAAIVLISLIRRSQMPRRPGVGTLRRHPADTADDPGTAGEEGGAATQA